MDGYLDSHAIEEGYRAPVQAFYEMSKDWYAGRREEGWEPFSPSQAMALWRSHGFSGPFWELG